MFDIYQVSPLSLSFYIFGEWVTKPSSLSGGGKLSGKYLHTLFVVNISVKIYPSVLCPPPTYLSNHGYLLYSLGYNLVWLLFILLLQSFQLWPLGGLSGWSLGNLTCPTVFCFCGHILTFWFCKIMPCLSCILLIQALKISHFSKELSENGI